METEVTNGDCLPACLAAALESMHFGRIESFDFEPATAKMRKDINSWIRKNWLKPCLFNMNMCYHELIALSHDAGISSPECKKRGPWPEDTDGKMARYISQEDDVYFCDAEMMAFAETMHEEGIDIVFRVWRNFTPSMPHKSTLISVTPDPEMLALVDIHEAVVVDLAHVGERDGRNAHYKLCNSGSLYGLIRVVTQRDKILQLERFNHALQTTTQILPIYHRPVRIAQVHGCGGDGLPNPEARSPCSTLAKQNLVPTSFCRSFP